MKKLFALIIFSYLVSQIQAQPISQLPAASTLNPADLIPIVQGGVTKKLSAAKIIQFISDSLSNVRIISDTCLQVEYRGSLDTICFSQSQGETNWSLDGDDIENNNTGDVIMSGQVFMPDITPSGDKYSGTVAAIGWDKRLFPKSIIDLFQEIIDSNNTINTPIYGNIIRVYDGDTITAFSDFSTAVDSSASGNIFEFAPMTFTESGTITLPANSVLKFHPGANLAGTFTLVGNNTYIDAGQFQIFGANVTPSGTWRYEYCTPIWTGADNTGAVSSSAAFIKMDSLFYDGATLQLDGGKYLLSSVVDWKIPKNRLKIKGNNSQIKGNYQNAAIRIWAETYVEDLFTNNFLTGFDSSVFIDMPGNEFIKGKMYVAIADSMDWKNNTLWQPPCKINITTTDSTGSDNRYMRSLTFTFNGFGMEDGNQVIYSLVPFPCDLGIDSMRRIGGVQMINIYPMWEDLKISDLNTMNCEVQISFVKNLTVENCNFSATRETQTNTRYGLWLNYTEGVTIRGYKSEWINYPGLGYGIVAGASDNLIIDNFYLNNNRHGISISGFYYTTTNNARITNGNVIATNVDSHGNVFGLVVDGVNVFNGGSVLSSRGNGGTVMNCKIFNGGGDNAGATYFYNVDPYDDDDIFVSNVISYNSIAPVVKLNDSINSENVIVENCKLFMNDSIAGTDAIVVSNHGKFKNLLIKDCYISCQKNDLGYFVYLDSLNTDRITIDNLSGKNLTYGIFLSGSNLDTIEIKNSDITNYNGVIQSLNSKSPLYVNINNNDFTNGDVILSIGSVTDSTHYDVQDNSFISLGRPIGGSPSKFTTKFINNYFRGYYSTSEIIPKASSDVIFSGNTIDVIDSTESQNYIAERTNGFSAVTFKDQLNFADSRATDITMRIEGNTILAKMGTINNDFTMTDGRLYFNRNKVMPIDGVFPEWWILFSNLDSASFIDNEFVFNNPTLTRVIYANTNTTTAGKFFIANNRVFNKASAGQFIGAGSSWTGASAWTVGQQSTIGIPKANTYGVNSTVSYSTLHAGQMILSNQAAFGVYSDGNMLFRMSAGAWAGVAGAVYNTYFGNTTGKINPSDAGTDYNIAIGYNAFANGDGANNNVAVGRNSLLAVSTGDYNIGIGYLAGGTNTTASYCTHIGRESGHNFIGAGNTSIGSYSLKGGSGATGTYNFAGGYESVYSNTSGSNNVGVGAYSLRSNLTGNYNIGIGYRAGFNEVGSYKFYVAADSTSPSVGMGSGSKILMYGDMSNAAKSNHVLNIYAKLSIGAYKTPTVSLDVTGSADISGYLKTGQGSIADNDATPDVSGYNNWIYMGTSNPVTITDLDNPVAGAYYVILGSSDTYTVTIADSGNFKLSAACVLGLDDVITLFCKSDNNYIEVSRSNN